MPYTDDQKTEAVKLAEQVGPTEASRQLDIPRRTIANWRPDTAQANIKKTQTARDTLAAQNTVKREELRSLLLHKAVDMLERMDEPHIDFRGKDSNQVTFPKAPAGAVKDYSVSVGILIDKYRLEMGEATGRTETIDLAVAESRVDQEIIRLTTQLNDAS